MREDPVPPQRLNPTIGPQVEAVLKKALAKSANDRYGNCTQFVDALAGALQTTPGWRPLPRSSAHSMPTMAGVVDGAETRGHGRADAGSAPVAEPPLQPAMPGRPPRPGSSAKKQREQRSPLLRSLVWMLVGIGLVGLVLFGAQKYLFNRMPSGSDTERATDSQTPGPPTPGSPPSGSHR